MPNTDSYSKIESTVSTVDVVDNYNLCYLIMILFGTGLLFPFNTYLTAVDYFNFLYPEYNLEFYFPMLFNYPSLIIMPLMIKYGRLLPLKPRIYIAFILNAFLILTVGYAESLFSSHSVRLFYILFSAFLNGCCLAVLQSTLFGVSSVLPGIYTQALSTGLGVAGLSVSLCRVATKAIVSDDAAGMRLSARIFFAISSVISILCIFGFLTLLKSPFFQFHSSKSKNEPLLHDDENNTTINSEPVSILSIFKKIKYLAISVWAVMCFTFLVFPGLEYSIKPSSSIDIGWFYVLLNTEFNFCDVLSRTAPRWFLFIKHDRVLFWALVRFIFVPLYFMGVLIHWTGSGADIFAYFITLFMALSNGYLCSLSMMYAPDLVEESERETAGLIMSFLLNFGIFCGSHIALIEKEILNV